MNRNEITAIIISTIVLGFLLTIRNFTTRILVYNIIAIFLVISVNLIAKKITSHHFDAEIETRLWDLKKPGLLFFLNPTGFELGHPSRRFKSPLQIGIIVPFIISIISVGYTTWLAPLVFDVKTTVYRAAKRHGLYSFSEMTESHIAQIAAAGIGANILFSIIGYLLGFPEFARLNIYYAFFNIIPFSDLDGNKIFFGHFVLWSFVTIVTLIALGYAFLLI